MIKNKDKLMFGIIILFMILLLLIGEWESMKTATNLQQALIGIPSVFGIFIGSYWISRNI